MAINTMRKEVKYLLKEYPKAMLEVDREATGELARIQDEAREVLKSAEIGFYEVSVKNDSSLDTITPTLQTSTGVLTGLRIIRNYAESVKNPPK